MKTHDDLEREYRRFRGWNPEPGETSRISLELPRTLVQRLNRQARLMDVARRHLIEAAVVGLLDALEKEDVAP